MVSYKSHRLIGACLAKASAGKAALREVFAKQKALICDQNGAVAVEWIAISVAVVALVAGASIALTAEIQSGAATVF